MDVKKIDALNVVLIIISLILAYNIPFGLFLFSYAVLGPLHYLTEINWLNGKKYFVAEKRYTGFLFLLAALVAYPYLLKLPVLAGVKKQMEGTLLAGNAGLNAYFIFSALIFSIGFVYFKKILHVIIYLIVAVVFCILTVKYVPSSVVAITIFIPTIVHVYLFTLLFMVFGTLNKKSVAGVVAIVAMILCPLVIALVPVDAASFQLADNVKNTFLETNFHVVNTNIAKALNLLEDDERFYLLSEKGLKIQVFIAFAYTYHYLNWFSKTSVIGWGKTISRKKLVIIAVVWLLSVTLYYLNYKTGLIALFFLSILHVFLEFPLNAVSVKTIINRITKPSSSG